MSSFLIPRLSRRFANLLAFSLNTPHVISLLYGAFGFGSISSYSLQVTRLTSVIAGFSSTNAVSLVYSLAFLSRSSVIGISLSSQINSKVKGSGPKDHFPYLTPKSQARQRIIALARQRNHKHFSVVCSYMIFSNKWLLNQPDIPAVHLNYLSRD